MNSKQYISNNLKFFRYRTNSLINRVLPPNKNFISNPDKIIKELVDGDEPILISRLGAVETSSIVEYKIFSSLSKKQINRLQMNAGFYMNKEIDLNIFVSLNIDSLRKSNLIGYFDFFGQYDLYNDLRLDIKYMTPKSFEPFWTSSNWISKMKEKNICVVSPFIKTMKKQLPILNKIHKNIDIKKHHFSFVLAPQTNAGYIYKTGHPDWFDRLDAIKNNILKTEPHLVLIGAGSYGLPLGGILKDIGISSIVCGGALQLLFGILGKRWVERSDYSEIFNDNWTRLYNSEIPNGHKLVENGCYW